MELISLILGSQSGTLSKSTLKSIVGVAVGVTLMLFITSKLDSFIINMEDYMLNFLPEVQFQRTRNTFPTSLKYSDAEKIQEIIGDDPNVLSKGSAFWERGIFQIKTSLTHINKDCLLFSGLLPSDANSNDYLLNIGRYLEVEGQVKDVLADSSTKVIISKRLEEKLFGNASGLGQSIQLGSLKSDEKNLVKLVVAGIYNNNSVNAIFLSRSSASKIIGKPKSKVDNAFIVRLKNKYLSKDWRKEILERNVNLRDIYKNKLAAIDLKSNEALYKKTEKTYNKYKTNADFLSPFLIRSWMDISPENLEYLKITRAIMLLIFSSIIVLSGLSIKFLFDTIILEKRRQISMLKVLGYTNYSIVKSFVFSGLFIGILGVIVGVVFGYALNWLVGMFENYYFDEFFSFQYINILPSIIFSMKVGLGVIFLCAVSTLPSAMKIMNTTPIEGLKRDN